MTKQKQQLAKANITKQIEKITCNSWRYPTGDWKNLSFNIYYTDDTMDEGISLIRSGRFRDFARQERKQNEEWYTSVHEALVDYADQNRHKNINHASLNRLLQKQMENVDFRRVAYEHTAVLFLDYSIDDPEVMVIINEDRYEIQLDKSPTAKQKMRGADCWGVWESETE